MSILIKGMEMPECCGYCPFEYKNYCMAKPSLMVESSGRHTSCPLVSVQPHGRLIDAEGNVGVNVRMMPGGKCEVDLIAPTILEAEEGE